MPPSVLQVGRRCRSTVLALVWAGGCWLSASSARAQAWDGFLQLNGIKGSSETPKYVDWMAVTDFTEGVSAGSLTADRVGKAVFAPLEVRRTVDRATPELSLAVADGRAITEGTLELVRRGVGQAQLLKLELKRVRILSVAASGVAGALPSEIVRLSFDELTVNSVKISTGQRLGLAGLSRGGALTANGDVAGHGITAGAEAGSLALASDSIPWLQRNLLENPGAESIGEPLDPSSPSRPPGWLAQGGFASLTSEALFGNSGPGACGARLFALVPEGDSGAGRQTVDLSMAAAEIDAGQLRAILAGWLGAIGGEQEAARLSAQFRDAAGGQLGLLAFGPGPDGEGWARWEQAAAVPPGSRAVDVTIELHRHTATAAGGRADDLSLVLERTSTESAELPVSIQRLQAGGVVNRGQVELSWRPPAGGVVIESATSLTGPWRRETGPTRLERGRESFVVPAGTEAEGRFWRVRPASSFR